MVGNLGAFRFNFNFRNRWVRLVYFIRVFVEFLAIVVDFQFLSLPTRFNVVRFQWFSFGLTSFGIFEKVQFYREASIFRSSRALSFGVPFP
jgi:hypothetical protein